MTKIHLDFETYSPTNLKESGAFRYAEDPDTQALILAYSIGDGPAIGVDISSSEAFIPEVLHPLFDAIDKGIPVCAHNAQFERLIWTKVLLHFPVVPKPLQCIVAVARNGVIGREGKLPWHIPEDLAWFMDLLAGPA